MTIADVSARTRIRPPIIRAIEQDDYGVCGGDFYARGHIRAIARTVGLDSESLVREYDAARLTGQPVTMDDLPGRHAPAPADAAAASEPPPAAQPRQPAPDWRQPRPSPRRRRARPSASLLAVLLTGLFVIGFGSYRVVTSGSGNQRLASAGDSSHPRASPHSAPASPRPAPVASTPVRTPVRTPSARPSPRHTRAKPAVHQVTPVSATAFGPAGTSDGDNPRNASLALSGDASNPWHTDWYTTARFGNLQSGTGLLLDLGRTVTATGVTIQLGSTPGADLQVRAGTSLGSLSTVASASDAGGTIRLRLTSPARVRYLVIWFTLLPPDSSGTYQADVSGVTVTAT